MLPSKSRDMSQGLPARSAVNIPFLKPETLEPVKHYMALAENLGSLVRQVTTGAAQEIEIVACGELAGLEISPLVVAVTKGVLECSGEGVNYVNAPRLAQKKRNTLQEIDVNRFRKLSGPFKSGTDYGQRNK